MNLPRHGGQLRQLAQEFDLDPESILDFSANINPDGPPTSVSAALRLSLDDPAALTTYPDLELTSLRRAIANSLPSAEVNAGNFLVANGFVPLLEAVLRALAPRRCVLAVPAFGEYRATLERCGVEVIQHRLSEPWFYNLEALEQQVRHTRADAVLLANPQNPTGVLSPAAGLRALAERNPGLHLLLDEAFIDYTPGESLVRDAAARANLTVFRSLTKFFAMPAMRVAYAVTGQQLAGEAGTKLAPWPVSRLAEVAARAALADPAYTRRTLAHNLRRRSELVAQLCELEIEPLPAAANFLLLPLERDIWRQLLVVHRVLTRHCGNFEHAPKFALRVGVRTEPENERLVAAIRSVLAS